MIETLGQDLRYAGRTFRRSPGFVLLAVLTIAVGVGANAAIFSVVNAVLLRPLPFDQSGQLVLVHETNKLTRQSTGNMSPANFLDYRIRTHGFTGLAALRNEGYTVIGDRTERWSGGLVSANFFDVLGVTPVLGRRFTPAEEGPGAARVAILSDGLWRQRFGARRNVIGESVRLNGEPHTIVGVAPAGVEYPDQAQLWTPGHWRVPDDSLLPGADPSAQRNHAYMMVLGRMKAATTREQAAADVAAVAAGLERDYPNANMNVGATVVSLRDDLVGDVRPTLVLLFAAVGLVLLIACVNFASLQLARSATRQREIAIRAALGAPSGRLIRQMLTESVLLALLGGAAGLVLAGLGVRLLMELKPAGLPRIANTSIDASVLGFTFAVSLLTGIVFGLLPALSTTFFGLNAKLKQDTRTTAGGCTGYRLRKFLVVSEIALALVLLISAGLMIRSFTLLHRVDPGFRTDNLLTMRVELPEARYHEQAKQRQFHREFLEALNAAAGVQAALVSELPMSGDYITHNFVIEGRPPLAAGSEPEVQTRTVEGDYFRVLGIPLLAGRDFGSQDRTGSLRVAVVNRAFVAQYFPGQDAIGARVQWARSDPPDWMTIVGVVGDIKHFGPGEPEEPAVYDLYSQTAQQWKRWMYPTIRGAAAPGILLGQVKQRLWAIDNQLPVTQVFTMNEVVAASLDHQRFNLTLLGIFAGVALALAVVGIYGVMSYAITQRTNEIGIRVALGAQQRDVLWLILGQGLRLALIGGSLGIAASLALTRYMSHLLFGISPRDPQTFVAIPFALLAVALLACYAPARRAVRVDPIIALRYE
jgi:putative ABC transport system permease protein